jgi:hypothetical protein
MKENHLYKRERHKKQKQKQDTLNTHQKRWSRGWNHQHVTNLMGEEEIEKPNSDH